ncbi:MAG: TIGR03960 family B12-binding radical SAM protein [Candidatus Omnitrophica bacterium]|nr:TIGR03960 family B12-binding radical SAM protein [Candidatus Omnitrophota bacterium]
MSILTQILQKVHKPGRYIGGEINSVRKLFKTDTISFALAFPDIYEIGMSHLGLVTVYHLLNEIENVNCERVFAPWHDMEAEMKKEGIPLFTLESKKPVREFDFFGFSMTYELNCTNILNMLSLSDVSILSKDRKEDEPIVVAGGGANCNPEPMSDFIDIFVIGDAEELLPEFMEMYASMKNTNMSRNDKLLRLSGIEGIYVPRFYSGEYEGNMFKGLNRLTDGAPACIKKRAVMDLDKAYYPVKQLVPYIKVIHDRISMEIMRGCPNRCRFCQAGYISRPLRLRKVETIINKCLETYKHTGHNQISLLSLSSVNYPYLAELIKALNGTFEKYGVGLSIPSLRIDESFYEVPEMIAIIKKTSLTFAPETALMELQKAIGKETNFDIFCKSVLEAYTHGWEKLKLYFMIGFPGDPEKEISSICKWTETISQLRTRVGKGPAEIKASINPFVPKPHTPFQWLGMQDENFFSRQKDILLGKKYKRLKFEVHDVPKSLLEGALSRGDRLTGKIIFSAWKKGARFDAWPEFFNFSIWDEAFKENGRDLSKEAARFIPLEDPLPWGHIDVGTDVAKLKSELLESGFYK